MTISDSTASLLATYRAQLVGKDAGQILAWASATFGTDVAFATSLGAEDQALTHLIYKHASGLPIFTLDTGRLFQETYDLLDKTEQKYGLKVRIMFPDREAVEAMVAERGINLFYDSIENRKMCCGVRKVVPLRRALAPLKAWITGLRREQSTTRTELQPIEWDEGNGIFKLNPLFDWTESQTWDYIKANKVPYSPLQDKGFLSIGCASCTRAVKPGEDVRAGRWWWERPEQKECGLHVVDGKLVPQRKAAHGDAAKA